MQKEPKQLTVGFELECLSPTRQFESIANRHNFGIRTDASICLNNGTPAPRAREFVTPIYTVDANINSESTVEFINLSQVRNSLQGLTECAADINSTCSFHLHIGKPSDKQTTWNPRRQEGIIGGPASEWKPAQVRTALALGLILEPKVYDSVPISRKECSFCRKISDAYSANDLRSYYPVGRIETRKYNNPKRYCWLNLIETRRKSDPCETRIGFASSEPYGTIEIRLLGETKNLDYLIAWTQLWLEFGMYIAYVPSDISTLQILSGRLDRHFNILNSLKQIHEQQDLTGIRCRIGTPEILGGIRPRRRLVVSEAVEAISNPEEL